MIEQAERKGSKQKLGGMEESSNKQTSQIKEYDEKLIRMLIDKTTILDDKIRVGFKSDAGIDVKN